MSQAQAQYRAQYNQRVQASPQVRRGKNATAANNAAAAAEAQRFEQRRQELEAQRVRVAEMELSRRKAAQPTDRIMPEGLEKLVIGDGLDQYKKLRTIERRLDGIMTRRRLDMQDSVHGGGALLGGVPPRMRKMKIWISNTVENQPWQGGGMEESAFDFNMGVEASYRVKIEGRLEDDGADDDGDDKKEGDGAAKDSEDQKPADGANGDAMEGVVKRAGASDKKPRTGTPPRKKTKLSHFFKSITVDFDRNKNLQPEGMTQVEWKRPVVPENATTLPASADFDTLEFERKSDENINCTINFYRDVVPEKYLLDKPLSALVDATEEDRDSVIIAIWEYVKTKGLQQDDEKRTIHCDDMMKAVFGLDIIYFPHIPTLLDSHMFPLPPLSVKYTIRVDPEYHNLPAEQRYTIYTLDVPEPGPPAGAEALKAAQRSGEQTKTELLQLRAWDQHIYLLIQALNNSRRRHTFFTQMSADPVNFTKRWMASQKHDLEVLLGEDGRLADGKDLSGSWSKGGAEGVWGSQDVKQAVQLMVEKPDRKGRPF